MRGPRHTPWPLPGEVDEFAAQFGSRDQGPVFQTPWEGRAFAMIVGLAQAGLFTWPQWVERLSGHIAAAARIEAAGGRPRTYSEQWIDAAEDLLIREGITSADQLRARRIAAWPMDTPHGIPSDRR